MQDKSIYNSSNKPQIFEGLQDFINAMVEEIVLKGEAFDDQKKKWLKKYSEAEGLNYTELEGNLSDFFELIEDYKDFTSQIKIRFLKSLAKECYIKDSVFENIFLKNQISEIHDEFDKQEFDEFIQIGEEWFSCFYSNYATSGNLNCLVGAHILDIDINVSLFQACKSLKELELGKYTYSDLYPLKFFSSLEKLTISYGTKLNSFDGIENCMNLIELDLYLATDLPSIKPITKLVNLEKLIFGGSVQEDSFHLLSELNKLKSLSLPFLDDLSFLGKLNNLETLYAPSLDDLSNIKHCSKLKTLSFGSYSLQKKLKNEFILSELPLENVYIDNYFYNIDDILKNLKHIKSLRLIGGKLKDINIIGEFKQIEHISLEYIRSEYKLLSITPLNNLNNLKNVFIAHCGDIDYAEIQQFKMHNPDCDLSIYK